MKKVKRILAMMLVFCMMVSVVPVDALAVEDTTADANAQESTPENGAELENVEDSENVTAPANVQTDVTADGQESAGDGGAATISDTETEKVLTLNKTALTLDVGGSETLTATLNYESASVVTWSSNSTEVATVKNGVVTAVAAGTATITASAEGVSANCEVTVKDVQTPDAPTVAKIGEKPYTSLPEAITNVEAGETIELIESCTIGTDYTIGSPLILSKDNVTINLNGNTITVTNNFSFLISGNNDVVQNGTIKAGSNSGKKTGINSYAIVLNAGDGIVLRNLTINGGISVGGSTNETPGAAAATNAVISGCTVTSGDWYAVCAQQNSTLTIESGTYTADIRSSNAGVIQGTFVGTDGPKGTITVTGGTFNGKIINNDIGDIILKGGTYTVDPSVYVAAGYHSIQGENDNYTVAAHKWNVKTESVETKVSDATCTAATKYYYSCECGAIGTKTFSVGSSLGHLINANDNYCERCESTFKIIIVNKATGKVSGKDTLATISSSEWIKFFDDVENSRIAIGAMLNSNLDVDIDLNGHTLTIKNTTSSPGIYFNRSSNNVVRIHNGIINEPNPNTNRVLFSFYNCSNNKLILGNDLNINCVSTAVLVENNGQLETSANITSIDSAIMTNGTTTKADSSIIINGGNIHSEEQVGIYLPAGNLTVNGGTITGDVAIYSKANLTINGGTFNGTCEKQEYEYNGNGCNPTGDAVVVDNCNYPGGVPVVSITGGTFNSTYASAVGSYAGKDVETPVTGFVTGGAFSTDPSAYVADGYAAYRSGNLYKVTKEWVATVGTSRYYTLQEAVNAAKDGETVKLTANVTTPIEKTTPANIKLDLNGYSITSDADVTFKNNGTGKVTIIGTKAGSAMTNTQVVETPTSASEGKGIVIWARLGEVEINGGTYTNNSCWEATIYTGTTNASLGGRTNKLVTIRDGLFRNISALPYQNKEYGAIALNVYNGNAGSQDIVVYGGTFQAGIDPNNGDDVKGGTFVANGYMSINNNDGTYTVVPRTGKVAAIGSTTYVSLAEAIEAVQDGEIITMLADVEAASGISVPSGKNFTIDFAGHTYSVEKPGAGSAGTTTQAFQLLKDSTITFKNGTINCTEANKTLTWDKDASIKGIALIIQNYCNLTRDNMVIDGTNIAHNGTNVRYIVSNNCGNVIIKDTKIIALEGDVAFDSCKLSDYDTPTVAVSRNSGVIGQIELSGGKLIFESGKLNGSIKTVDGYTLGDARILGGYFALEPDKAYIDSARGVTDTPEGTEKNAGYKYLVGESVTVTVKSALEEADKSVANVTGGGEYIAGTTVKLTAPELTNFDFMGWYKGDTCMEQQYKYEFVVTSDMAGEYVAKYSVKADAQVEVKATAKGSGTVSYSAGSDSMSNQNEVKKQETPGTTVTLTATPEQGKKFAYWTNQYGRVISKETEYKVDAVRNIEVEAVFNEAGSATVVFEDDKGNLIGANTYSDSANISEVVAPSKMGSKFNGWTASEDTTVTISDQIVMIKKGETLTDEQAAAIVKAAANGNTNFVTVKANYEPIGTYKITIIPVINGVRQERQANVIEKNVGTPTKITVDSESMLKTPFDYLELQDGTKVYSTTYVVNPLAGEYTYLVYYNESAKPLVATGTISINQPIATYTNTEKIDLTMSWNLPEGAELLDAGFYYHSVETNVINHTKAVYHTGLTTRVGSTTCHVIVKGHLDSPIYAQAFVKFSYDNKEYTVYSSTQGVKSFSMDGEIVNDTAALKVLSYTELVNGGFTDGTTKNNI